MKMSTSITLSDQNFNANDVDMMVFEPCVFRYTIYHYHGHYEKKMGEFVAGKQWFWGEGRANDHGNRFSSCQQEKQRLFCHYQGRNQGWISSRKLQYSTVIK